MSALPCVVTADLTRHLGELDDQDRFERAIERLAESWLDNPIKVAEVWNDEVESYGYGLTGEDVAGAMVGHGLDREVRALRLLDLIEGKIESKIRELAAEAVNDDEPEPDDEEDIDAELDSLRWGGVL